MRPDELDLWKRIARHADPIHPKLPGPAPTPPKTAAPKPPAKARDTFLPDFRIGQVAKPALPRLDRSSGPAEDLARAPLAMDRKAYTRMKRGKLQVDARIDLHGLTLAQAHPRLTQFILSAHSRGDRLVLVITGKGKSKRDEGPIPQRTGVLKHQVPQWLHGAGLGHTVLQIAQAHQSHGGTGAYYVYLRRSR